MGKLLIAAVRVLEVLSVAGGIGSAGVWLTGVRGLQTLFERS